MAATTLCAEEIDAMSYRDLQKTCKSHGIKANSKAAVLRTELQKLINVCCGYIVCMICQDAHENINARLGATLLL